MSTFKLYFVKLLNLGWENDLVVKALALQAASVKIRVQIPVTHGNLTVVWWCPTKYNSSASKVETGNSWASWLVRLALLVSSGFN